MTGEKVDFVGEVFMQEAMSAYADGDEEQRVQEFIERDEEQKTIVALAAGSGF